MSAGWPRLRLAEGAVPAVLLAALLVACRAPEAGIELEVWSAAGLGLDGLELQLSAPGVDAANVPAERVPLPPRPLSAVETLGLVLRDPGLIDADVRIQIVGLSGGATIAQGETEVATRAGAVIRAGVTLGTCGGDGILTGTEQCDDGNTSDGDGCSALCAVEVGYLCAGEPSQCATDCGDGVVTGMEQCDAGALNDDTIPGACRTTCLLPACGDGVADPTDACDDGNTANDDGCLTSCALPWCGDGFVAVLEEACDDGNTAAGDGCASDCMVEPLSLCRGVPSTCAPWLSSWIVDPNGGGDFPTVAAAVAAVADGSTLFLVSGIHEGTVTIATDVTLVGVPGAVMQTSDAWPQTLAVTGGATVTLVGLAIQHTGVGGSAVRVTDSAVATFIGCTLGPSDRYGLEAEGGTTVLVSRSLVADNTAGGLKLDEAFSVENSAIVRNGSATAAFGGADLQRVGTFRFNTVAHNQASANAAVRCQSAMVLASSIITDNDGAAPSSLCDVTSGSTVDPEFAADGYHLARGSMARDAGPTTGCPASDIDGDPRPLGAACALGADERP